MIINTKFKSGKYLVPVKLLYEDNYIYIQFSYNKTLLSEIKMMEGAHWCGYDEPSKKLWRINNSQHNKFQIEYLEGKNPYSLYDSKIIQHEYERPLYEHQRYGADFLLTVKRAILAGEMGCVDGNAVVEVRRGARSDVHIITLANFYKMFHTSTDNRYRDISGNLTKEVDLNFRIKAMNGNKAKYIEVFNVLKRGVRKIIEIKLQNGMNIRVTPDHEIGVKFDQYEMAENLEIGDFIRICRDHMNIGYSPLSSKKEVGDAEVYDVVCDEPFQNFLANGINVHNCGKSLIAIETMERSGSDDWLYVGPKSAMKAVEYELKKWKSKVHPLMLTYQGLTKLVKRLTPEDHIPANIWLDESHRIKNPTAQRSQAALEIADHIRKNPDSFIILTSGSPAPKSPLDWFNQCRVACPGFLREGTYAKFRDTLAIISQKENAYGQAYPEIVSWLDDEKKCSVCGQYAKDHSFLDHAYVPSVNECSRLHKRMKGLVLVQFKRDCLDLPEKIYRRIELPVSKQMKDVAKTLVAGAKTVASGLILVRELSDGFQYIETETGSKVCSVCNGRKEIDNPLYCADIPFDSMPKDFDPSTQPKTTICDGCGGLGTVKTFSRTTEEVETPKEDALKDLLDEYSDIGRVVIYAGFTGSIDRCVRICKDSNWNYIRADGRGWISDIPGEHIENFQDKLIEYPRIAFIGQPGAAGSGLTLTASPIIIYFSNDFDAEHRIQSEDRCHRPGMDVNRGCTIADLLHLPTDYLVLDNLKKKRDLQSLTLGEILNSFEESDATT